MCIQIAKRALELQSPLTLESIEFLNRRKERGDSIYDTDIISAHFNMKGKLKYMQIESEDLIGIYNIDEYVSGLVSKKTPLPNGKPISRGQVVFTASRDSSMQLLEFITVSYINGVHVPITQITSTVIDMIKTDSNKLTNETIILELSEEDYRSILSVNNELESRTINRYLQIGLEEVLQQGLNYAPVTEERKYRVEVTLNSTVVSLINQNINKYKGLNRSRVVEEALRAVIPHFEEGGKYNAERDSLTSPI